MSDKQKKRAAGDMDRRTFIKTVGGAGLAVSTLGFPGIVRSAGKPGEIEVGVIYPMSGRFGPFGQNGLRGWHIAIDEINQDGGIFSLGGAKIKTVLRDSEGSPKIGMAETEKIAKSKAVAIVGAYNSNVTIPGTQLAEQYGIPWIVDMSLSDKICRRGFKYTFRTVMEGGRAGANLVEFVNDVGKKTKQEAKTAVIMGMDNVWGKIMSKSYQKGLKKYGIKLLADAYYPLKTTDLTVEIAKLKAKKPDVWFFTSGLNDAVLISRSLYQQRVEALCFVTNGGGYANPKFLSLAGKLGTYFGLLAKYDYDMNTKYEQDFDKKMRERYGVAANSNSAVLYVAAYVLKDALERAGSTDRDKIRDALEATHITSGPAMMMPGKGIKFDKNHENELVKDMVAQSFPDGRWHIVWPYERKRQFDPVWPRPSWNAIEKML